MVEYKRIAHAGAAGSLGIAVFKALIDAGFEVTALVRTAGKLPSEYAGRYKEAVVDFSSEASLTSALRGQDALVSTVGTAGLAVQENLVRASVAAGVKRVLPSEFGCDLSQPSTRALPTFSVKIKLADLLESEAARSGGQLTYTYIHNNIFLDWYLQFGLLGDVRGKTATTIDAGRARGSLTRLSTVAAAVVAVLRRPEETANQRVRVQDGALSHAEILEAIQEVTGPGWAVEDEKTEDVKAKSDEALAKGVLEPWVFIGYIRVAAFSEEGKSDFTGNTWNARLGLKEYSTEETKGLVKDVVKGILAA